MTVLNSGHEFFNTAAHSLIHPLKQFIFLEGSGNELFIQVLRHSLTQV